MTLGQLHRPAINASLQQLPPRFVATINPSYYRLPTATWLAPKRSALLRTHPPRQPNPHSRARGAFRPPSPAGSFLGGFRTPAQMRVAQSHMAGIRNPAQEATSSLRPSSKQKAANRGDLIPDDPADCVSVRWRSGDSSQIIADRKAAGDRIRSFRIPQMSRRP
jgi:hypothetical protein